MTQPINYVNGDRQIINLSSKIQKIVSIAFAMFIGIAATGLTVSSARATVILDVVNSQLISARNVVVDGRLFDVEFLDGSCASLFNGCDAVTDFVFQSQLEAQTAARALLDQVFILDPATSINYDFNPILTQGCDDIFSCETVIPFNLDGSNFRGFSSRNNRIGADFTFLVLFPPTRDVTDVTVLNFARFTAANAVPEPGALALFGIGLAGLGVMRRQLKMEIKYV